MKSIFHSSMPSVQVMNSVGWITLVVCLAVVVVFYLVLGRWRAVFYSLLHWSITFALVIAFAFIYASRMVSKGIGPRAMMFGLANCVVAFVIFIVLSFIAKRGSIFAKSTPF